MADLPKPLCGVVPPVITPLIDNDTLDVEGHERLIEHIIAGGVHGLFILGTTGEGTSLSSNLQTELIERTCKQVADRVPILVGITDTAFTESLNIAKIAADKGAQGLVLAHPCYFPSADPEMLASLKRMGPQLPLPTFLYNMPSHTKLTFAPATVKAAADIPNIVGLKDSGGKMVYFHVIQTLVKDRPDFSLLVGPEEMLAEAVLLGANGGVCGGANMKPQLYVGLYNAAAANDLEKVASLHAEVMAISTRIYCAGKYGSSYLKGLKCALSCMGICSGQLAEPFEGFKGDDKKKIAQYVEELGLKPNK